VNRAADVHPGAARQAGDGTGHPDGSRCTCRLALASHKGAIRRLQNIRQRPWRDLNYESCIGFVAAVGDIQQSAKGCPLIGIMRVSLVEWITACRGFEQSADLGPGEFLVADVVDGLVREC
jgi:hypothetical protein